MRYTETGLPGAFLVDMEKREDERGFFARIIDVDEFARNGLTAAFVQANQSFNQVRGTVRGLHLQVAPHAEIKLVRCVRGAIFDVAVDMRPDSPTYLEWRGFELSADNRRAFYIPEGFAHGFQSLTETSELIYTVSAPYTPAAERGFRYNDRAIGIDWPLEVASISDKDAAWPLIVRD